MTADQYFMGRVKNVWVGEKAHQNSVIYNLLFFLQEIRDIGFSKHCVNMGYTFSRDICLIQNLQN